MSEEEDFNPYAAPTEAAEGLDEEPEDGRVGPPWEMKGPLVRRFLGTVAGAMFSPSKMFAETRREGREGSARTYGLLAGTIGFVFFTFYFMLASLVFDPEGLYPGVPPEERTSHFLQFMLGMLCCSVAPIPIYLLINLYLYTAFLHLSLFLVRGAKRRMGTTLRAISYSVPSTMLWSVIPGFGFVLPIQGIYVLMAALSELHGISRVRALCAIFLLPVVIVLLGAAFLIAVIVLFAVLPGGK